MTQHTLQADKQHDACGRGHWQCTCTLSSNQPPPGQARQEKSSLRLIQVNAEVRRSRSCLPSPGYISTRCRSCCNVNTVLAKPCYFARAVCSSNTLRDVVCRNKFRKLLLCCGLPVNPACDVPTPSYQHILANMSQPRSSRTRFSCCTSLANILTSCKRCSVCV
jgi:hypothetical protein